MKILSSITFIALLSSAFAVDDSLHMVAQMYGSGKARNIGDLVTISINESSSSTKAESLSTDKSASKAATSDILSKNVQEDNGLFKLLNDYATLKGLTISSTSNFAGSGNASTSENLSAQITARVVDVLPNGTLVIKGERRVKMKHEEVHIVMTGIIRGRDISKTNIINSNKISDAHIYYETSGDVTDGAQPGIVWRLLQYINPF
ncbi:MAG: flagellar basal body L-ring protein FlgH [Lentisphaeraceae bacterium]|nr:flagellar basal body L-ring protein FlgH [Lentisphaeraceae bacterium]